MNGAGMAAVDVSVRRLVGIATPLALHGLISVLIASNDVILLGTFSPRVIASGAAASAVLTVVVMGVGAFGMATQIEASRAVGGGDRAGATRAVEATLRLVLMVSLPLVALLWLVAPALVEAVGGTAVDADVAGPYLRITILGAPLAAVAAVLRGYATALGRTRVVFVASIAAAGTDVGASLAGAHVFGWHGVAAGTVAGYVVSVGIFVAWVSRSVGTDLRPHLRPRLPGPAEKRQLALGWPEALLGAFSAGSGVVITFVLSGSPPQVLAGSRLLDVQTSLAWVAVSAIGQATLTLLGQALGAERPDLFRRTLRTGIRLAAGVAAVVFLTMGSASPWIVRAVGGADVATEVGGVAWLAWAQVWWMALVTLTLAVCRAHRDTRAAMWASLSGEYAVFLPLGLVLCRVFDLELLGVFVAHHAFWMTFAAIALLRARRAVHTQVLPGG